MDDPRPPLAADARQPVAAMRQEGIDQGAFLVAGCGMHDQPGRLVEHDQVIILEQYFEGNVFGLRRGRDRRGQRDSKTLSGADGFGGFGELHIIPPDMAFLDEGLDARTRQIGEGVRQKAISTPPGFILGSNDAGLRNVVHAMFLARIALRGENTVMRALVVATVVMGVMIVVGTATLLFLVAQRLSTPTATAAPMVLDEPVGTRIVGLAAVSDRLAVSLQGGGSDRLVLIDPRSLRVVGRVGLAH